MSNSLVTGKTFLSGSKKGGFLDFFEKTKINIWSYTFIEISIKFRFDLLFDYADYAVCWGVKWPPNGLTFSLLWSECVIYFIAKYTRTKMFRMLSQRCFLISELMKFFFARKRNQKFLKYGISCRGELGRFQGISKIN